MADTIVQLQQRAWRQGSYEATTLGATLVLVADVVNGAGESKYSALREPGAAGGYVVTAGRTLYITRIIFSSVVVNALWLLGSGTADAGDSQAAAPAGAAAEDARADGVANPLVAQAAFVVGDFDYLVSIAAGRFPFLRCLTALNTFRVLAIGHEE
jgi:hypothetical protein